MSVMVTGASGRLGQLAVGALLERVAATDLILVSRTPERLQNFARLGAAVRFGDFAEPGSLAAAFSGASLALVISTLGSADPSAGHRAAFAAAARAGVQRIAYTSVTNPAEDNPFPPARTHARSEADLRSSGVQWTILRNSLYADLRAEIAASYLRDGQWTTNAGDGTHAFVARADCADAAAAALLDDRHAGRVYDITGPELIDASRYVALLTELGGRAVRRRDVDDEEYERYRSDFSADPANAGYFELFAGTGRAIRAGQMSVLGNGVQQLTGHRARPMRDLLRQCLQRAAG